MPDENLRLIGDPDQPPALTGVVEPLTEPTSEEPQDDEAERRPYDLAVAVLRAQSTLVKAQITELVASRAAVNDEIRILRQEDERLTRMLRVADGPTPVTEADDDG